MRDIEGMSGLEFERFLASLFAKLGYTEIELTPVNDQGGDIICIESYPREYGYPSKGL